MGTEDTGLTLEGLAQRLEALERENERMRSENAELRRRVAPLEGSESERSAGSDAEAEEKVSRKALLGKAAAAAVAATAAGTLLNPREAKADVFANVQSQTYVSAETFVQARTFVQADGGLLGYKNSGTIAAVDGFNPGAGPGVSGDGGHNGVLGFARASEGYGVEGSGDTGVHGHTSKTGYSGVYGLHQGSAGYGVVGDGTGAGAGVLGRNAGGPGVEARDSRYGGKFDGSRAHLLLVPKGTTGRPTTGSHTKGEIYMDSAGALFLCTKSGTPGTWRKVTTTAA